MPRARDRFQRHWGKLTGLGMESVGHRVDERVLSSLDAKHRIQLEVDISP